MKTHDDTIARIKERAKDLHRKTDLLNARIDVIEKNLVGTGVEFFWESQDGGPELGVDVNVTERVYWVLGYTKLGDSWRIVVQERPERLCENAWIADESADDTEPVALVRSSRSIRIEAAPHLEGFLERLCQELELMEDRVDKALAQMKGKS